MPLVGMRNTFCLLMVAEAHPRYRYGAIVIRLIGAIHQADPGHVGVQGSGQNSSPGYAQYLELDPGRGSMGSAGGRKKKST
jgi:hypothetical protein